MTTNIAKATLRPCNEAKAVLRNYHALVERTYKGDIDAIIALVDLESAVSRANLTDRQSEAIRLIYVDDLAQKEACQRMGIERSALTEHLRLALDSIEAIYEYDAWQDGDITKYELEAEASA